MIVVTCQHCGVTAPVEMKEQTSGFTHWFGNISLPSGWRVRKAGASGPVWPWWTQHCCPLHVEKLVLIDVLREAQDNPWVAENLEPLSLALEDDLKSPVHDQVEAVLLAYTGGPGETLRGHFSDKRLYEELRAIDV